MLMSMAFTVLSNAFVPLDGLPRWLQLIAEWNPISAVVSVCRNLWGKPETSVSSALAAQYPVPAALVALGLMLAVVAPLAARAYHRAAAR